MTEEQRLWYVKLVLHEPGDLSEHQRVFMARINEERRLIREAEERHLERDFQALLQDHGAIVVPEEHAA